jgi:hypothetical protein
VSHSVNLKAHPSGAGAFFGAPGLFKPESPGAACGLILAVFIGATWAGARKRVCRAQRLKAKIDAIATSAGGRDRMPHV